MEVLRANQPWQCVDCIIVHDSCSNKQSDARTAEWSSSFRVRQGSISHLHKWVCGRVPNRWKLTYVYNGTCGTSVFILINCFRSERFVNDHPAEHQNHPPPESQYYTFSEAVQRPKADRVLLQLLPFEEILIASPHKIIPPVLGAVAS